MSDLSLSGVGVLRGAHRVLDQVDVRFVAGRLTAVIGPNGAGEHPAQRRRRRGPAARPFRRCPPGGCVPIAAIGRRDLARRRAYLPQAATVDWPISVERVVALGLTPLLPTFGGLPATLQPKIDEALADLRDLLALRERPAADGVGRGVDPHDAGAGHRRRS